MTKPGLQWKRVCVAITLLVLVRGVFLLSVLPPYEGWDEYQHIAYIVYLREQRELPVYGVSKVPSSMVDMVAKYPHPYHSSLQHRHWGTRHYGNFWTTKPNPPLTDPGPIHLYQAQQGPLYYVVALPFWIIFSHFGYLAGIYGLRLINLLLLAFSVLIFLKTMAQCIQSFRHRLIIALLVGTSPLFLITGARVANCTLSILLGSLTLYFTVRAIKKGPMRDLILAACFLGLGILAKATMLAMIPVVFAGALIWVYKQKFSIKATLKAFAIIGIVVFLFLAPLLYRNHKTAGGVYVMAQDRGLQMKKKSTLWALSHVTNVGWSTRLRRWVFTRALWESGWNFGTLPAWVYLPYNGVMYVFWCVVIGSGLKRGWSKQQWPRPPEHLFSENSYFLVFASVVFFMVLGMAYFATISLADWGVVAEGTRYFMIALPAWTALLYQAALFVGARFAFWFAHILLGFHVFSEWLGTLYLMPLRFTNTNWSLLSWTRLAEVHPFFPSPWFIIPSLAVIVVLLAYLLRLLWQRTAVDEAAQDLETVRH